MKKTIITKVVKDVEQLEFLHTSDEIVKCCSNIRKAVSSFL